MFCQDYYHYSQYTGNVKCYRCVSTLDEDCDDPFPDYSFVSTCTGDVCYKAKYETEGRVRGVDGSCAKHLTVESYMAIYAPNSYTIIISFSAPTLSFIPDLKPFSANPSHCSLSFFFFRTDYMIPQTFTVTSSTGCFTF